MAAKSAPTSLAGKQSDQVWTSYTLVMTPEQTIEDALESDFWSHVAKYFRPYDRVNLIAEDGSYVAELMVTTAGGSYAKVAELWRWLRPDDAAPQEAGHAQIAFVKWRGPVAKWSIIRKSDSECLRDRFAEKSAADQWLNDYVATVTR